MNDNFPETHLSGDTNIQPESPPQFPSQVVFQTNEASTASQSLYYLLLYFHLQNLHIS